MPNNHTIHPLEAAVKAEEDTLRFGLRYKANIGKAGYVFDAEAFTVIAECWDIRKNRPVDDTARRIAAALNAVEGIPTEALEHGAVVGLIDAVTNAISRLAGGRTVGRELTPAQLVALEDMLWVAYHATYQEDDSEQ